MEINTVLRNEVAERLRADVAALAYVHPGRVTTTIDPDDLPAAYISTPESTASSDWLDEPGDDTVLQIQIYVLESNAADALLDMAEQAVRGALSERLDTACLQWSSTVSAADEDGSDLAAVTLTFDINWR